MYAPFYMKIAPPRIMPCRSARLSSFIEAGHSGPAMLVSLQPAEKKKYIAITGILERVFKNPNEMTVAFKNKVLKVGDIINVDYRQINDPTADALARTIKASGIKRLEENPDLAEKLIFAVQKGFEAGNEEMIKIAAGLENTEWKGYFKKQKEQQPPKIITP